MLDKLKQTWYNNYSKRKELINMVAVLEYIDGFEQILKLQEFIKI